MALLVLSSLRLIAGLEINARSVVDANSHDTPSPLKKKTPLQHDGACWVHVHLARNLASMCMVPSMCGSSTWAPKNISFLASLLPRAKTQDVGSLLVSS